jgi:hypothetical protein
MWIEQNKASDACFVGISCADSAGSILWSPKVLLAGGVVCPPLLVLGDSVARCGLPIVLFRPVKPNRPVSTKTMPATEKHPAMSCPPALADHNLPTTLFVFKPLSHPHLRGAALRKSIGPRSYITSSCMEPHMQSREP